MRHRNSSLKMYLFFATLLLVLGFQNCTGVVFESGSSGNAFKSDNNGIGYNGKPVDEFVGSRFPSLFFRVDLP